MSESSASFASLQSHASSEFSMNGMEDGIPWMLQESCGDGWNVAAPRGEMAPLVEVEADAEVETSPPHHQHYQHFLQQLHAKAVAAVSPQGQQQERAQQPSTRTDSDGESDVGQALSSVSSDCMEWLGLPQLLPVTEDHARQGDGDTHTTTTTNNNNNNNNTNAISSSDTLINVDSPLADMFSSLFDPARDPYTTPSAPATAQDTNMDATELRKRRRRHQVLTSVKRHREKKKKENEALQLECVALTASLAALQQARQRHPVVMAQQSALTQRQRREQAIHVNAQLKMALFECTEHVRGARAILAHTPVARPREMQLHDYLHAYTVLRAGPPEARRQEYLACMPESKLQLAWRVALCETDPIVARMMTTNESFHVDGRMLHDNGRGFVPDDDCEHVGIRQECAANESIAAVLPVGNGLVVKKHVGVLLFDEQDVGAGSLAAFVADAAQSIKNSGIFWPSDGFFSSRSSRVQDKVTLEMTPMPDENKQDCAVKVNHPRVMSSVLYTDIHGILSSDSLDLVHSSDGDGLASAPVVLPTTKTVSSSSSSSFSSSSPAIPADIHFEARMLHRVYQTEKEAVIVWDYVDHDDQHPHPLALTSGGDCAFNRIRRDTCGVVVVRREPEGKISLRLVSSKMYAPLVAAQTRPTAETLDPDRMTALHRRVNIQASEMERRLACLKHLHDTLLNRFTSPTTTSV